MLKALCLVILPGNIAIKTVIQLGPDPRAKAIIKFAAVNAAPLVSGGLTFMIQGRTFTEGKLANVPPKILYIIAVQLLWV